MELDAEEEKLDIPDSFAFPFQPYQPQDKFMKKLYSSLEEKKLGIFESPTGTGKSLALICGAIRWLHDHEDRQLAAAEASVRRLQPAQPAAAAASDDWIAQQGADRERRQRLQLAEKQLAALQRARAVPQPQKRSWGAQELDRQKEEFRALFGEEGEGALAEDASAEDADLIQDFGSGDEDERDDEEEEEEEHHRTQIIYTSRTHSQLSQFVGEVRRSPHVKNVRVAALASRPQLCINDAVRKLGSVSLVNQACLDLQQKPSARGTRSDPDGGTVKKQKATGACPFKRHVDEMAAEVLSEVRDIEQLVEAGRRRKACPYYASRRAVRHAQLVVVPYNNLLHRATREACGLRIKDNIVIVDEAHNLLETINGIHSCQLSRRQVAEAAEQLQHYIDSYRTRFSPRNLLCLKQLLFVHKGLLRLVDGAGKPAPSAAEATRVLTFNDFMCEAGIDNLNLHKLLVFAEKSRLVQKLRGCWRRRQVNPAAATATGRSAVSQFLRQLQQPATSPPTAKEPAEKPVEEEKRASEMPLMATLQLITALSEPDRDCRLIVSTTRAEPPVIKYLALNAAAQFQTIVQEARSVVLAGGTMQPVSEFRDQLFIAAGAAPERVEVFCCGHVVPPDQLLVVSLATGPSGAPLSFNYQSRAQKDTLDELGRLLLGVCRLVPDGVVCFLPSYDYASAVLTHLTASGVLQKINDRKIVFREPRQSNRAEAVLSEYTQAVCSGQRPPGVTGAVLFCVVGGKMSEGINFSNELGRCVIVVGLPYPNARSPELIEKMRFLDRSVARSPEQKSPGQVLYENLCMKAVNQSIGRAIRHRDDYACVLLCDGRYARPGTSSGLPEWIQSRLQHHPKFGPALAQIRKFFVGMQEKFPRK